ncbi:helix-turn-helix transcriptional regulator [Komagataeibacter intermedius]|uniref:Helix-turn-helix protein n=3 Tax=Komagataeibacter intermedius TaxID=66229 RepID=A0A0N0MGK9_9PROT|nr:Helix-turn-helix protein [Komagataeibacter intermedius AF2]MCF3634945.1 helix-turn-helix transcriptional regulator [Komagataeibacter intermedius]GAN86322.1 hypothetical protein Gain_0026_035 [Komagataeibacter intermedius TF2]GBQ66555.1 hypothetical protein AA0521_0774 [Komagataeibacter intermedius NRIC 0521]
MSQSALARAVGITPQAIQAMEAGTTSSSRHLLKIAQILEVDAIWLQHGYENITAGVEPGEIIPIGTGPMVLFQKTDKKIDEREDWRFDVPNIPYVDHSVPLYIASPIAVANMPAPARDHIANMLFLWIRGIHQSITEDRARRLSYWAFYNILNTSPAEWLPRPGYLKDIPRSYALYVNGTKNPSVIMHRDLTDTVLYITPEKRVLINTPIIIWHKTNTFIMCEYINESDDFIEIIDQGLVIDHYISNSKLKKEDLDENVDFPFTIKIPKNEIVAVHTILGAHFGVPRNDLVDRWREIKLIERESIQKDL